MSRPPFQLYPFTPYDERGLGYAYNRCCAAVPGSGDWVCLMDGDVMMLPGTWGSHAEACVARHPRFDVYVCMATRTWQSGPAGEKGAQQLRDPDWVRECRDLARLYAVVAELAERRYGEVVPWPDRRAPSGFFMLFQRRVWDAVRFPLLGSTGKPRIGIETAWFRTLFKRGLKVGLCVGLCAVHFYRLDRPDGRSLGYLAT